MIRRKNTGFFPSTTPSAYHSTLERDFLEILRFDKAVLEFRVQYPKIEFRDASRKSHVYTPDVWVKYTNQNGAVETYIYEIKARGLLAQTWLEFKPKLRAALAYTAARGWRFKILDEKRIRTPYLANARFLTRYQSIDIDQECANALLEVISDLRESDASSILASTVLPNWDRPRLLAVLWHLVATRRIGADLRQQLTMKSRLWATGEVAS